MVGAKRLGGQNVYGAKCPGAVVFTQVTIYGNLCENTDPCLDVQHYPGQTQCTTY